MASTRCHGAAAAGARAHGGPPLAERCPCTTAPTARARVVGGERGGVLDRRGERRRVAALPNRAARTILQRLVGLPPLKSRSRSRVRVCLAELRLLQKRLRLFWWSGFWWSGSRFRKLARSSPSSPRLIRPLPPLAPPPSRPPPAPLASARAAALPTSARTAAGLRQIRRIPASARAAGLRPSRRLPAFARAAGLHHRGVRPRRRLLSPGEGKAVQGREELGGAAWSLDFVANRVRPAKRGLKIEPNSSSPPCRNRSQSRCWVGFPNLSPIPPSN
ncbi:hypothetical protein PVAP13_7KG296875 [Panicum virgatum]|uniref:Uncharacterized protein n=1 Tax=Panicum virgatum TaxID=38727 RepID=A0A8T0QH30_PANVG|nr:hypothetical protein PVAP13_7KG296875 [Panicum virgatum]